MAGDKLDPEIAELPASALAAALVGLCVPRFRGDRFVAALARWWH
jgi:hypothetical protein